MNEGVIFITGFVVFFCIGAIWICNIDSSDTPRGNKRPKYRLDPDADGTYTLERYDSLVGWLCVDIGLKSQEEADIVIRRLEGKKFYFYEDLEK